MARRIIAVSTALALGALICAGALAGFAQGAPGQASAGARLAAKRGAPKRLDVVLGLDRRQRALERFALRVSDPASPLYGGYLHARRIGLRFGATDAVLRRVLRFLRKRRIRGRVDITRSFVEALVPARRARRLFRSPSGRPRVPRALRGRVREVLLDLAGPQRFLPGAKRSRAGASRSAGSAGPKLAPPYVRTGTPSGCPQGRNATAPVVSGPLSGPAFTPNQLQAAYGAAPLHARGVDGSGVRVAIYAAEGIGFRELRAYARCFGFQAPPTRLVKVGTRSAGLTTGEAALDLQMVALMAPGLESLTAYSIGSGFLAVGFSAMLDPRNGKTPNVISISQGECETAMAPARIRLAEHVLAATAAAGVTVAAGAGDNGSFCPDGPNRGFYPAASPWLTSVGGTSLTLDRDNRIVDEIPWNDKLVTPRLGLGGGGGFSRSLRRPPFQRGLGRWGNRRGYPDVALIADSYPGIAINCRQNDRGYCDASLPGDPFIGDGGTSASTPLFAGIVALVDQRLRAAGRPPLGFANPLFYLLGRHGGRGALRDIAKGSNSVLWKGCCKAFPGYDRASGWGSVNATGLAAAALDSGPR